MKIYLLLSDGSSAITKITKITDVEKELSLGILGPSFIAVEIDGLDYMVRTSAVIAYSLKTDKEIEKERERRSGL